MTNIKNGFIKSNVDFTPASGCLQRLVRRSARFGINAHE